MQRSAHSVQSREKRNCGKGVAASHPSQHALATANDGGAILWKGANNQDVKRWGTLILVCLLLGVVTTVAVAWTCVIAGAHQIALPWVTHGAGGIFDTQTNVDSSVQTEVGRCPGHYRAWRGSLLPNMLYVPMEPSEYETIVPGWAHFAGTALTPEDAAWFGSEAVTPRRQMEMGAGWPMLALSGFSKSIWVTNEAGRQEIDNNIGLFKGPSWLRPHSWIVVYLPYRPIWLGFMADSLVWGIPWLAVYLFAWIGFTRRKRMRMKRGQCLACGYSLVGNTTGKCPECGEALAYQLSRP